MDMNDKKQRVAEVLEQYKAAHPRAEVDVRVHEDWAIRIRIVAPDFIGQDLVERENEVWKLLEQLPDEVFCDITMLLLLTPKEAQKSIANMEFEDPTPSRL